MRSPRLLLRRALGHELDFHERIHAPDTYHPVSAVTGGPFDRRVEYHLNLAARRFGCQSRYWATAHALHVRYAASVLPGLAACGVGIGLGHGPLEVYNVAALEATDAHFLLQAHPVPDGLDTTGDHLLLCDGQWQRHRHQNVRSTLDGALAAISAASTAAGVAVANAPFPRRWIDVTTVASRRAALLPGTTPIDAVGRGGLVLFNIDHCDRSDDIERFWAEATPAPPVAPAAAQKVTVAAAEVPPPPHCPYDPTADLGAVVDSFVAHCQRP